MIPPVVQVGDFDLTLEVDSSVEDLESIDVDIISTTEEGAKDLLAPDPDPAVHVAAADRYYYSRETGKKTQTHIFKSGHPAFNGTVPSVDSADTLVLWAELAKPVEGIDRRMRSIPLKLNITDPAKPKPKRPKIHVKLNNKGWDVQ